MIRVVLPAHLRTLARVDGEVRVDVTGPATQRSVLDALEEGRVDRAVSAGNVAVWPRSHRTLWELYQFGLETLVDMSTDEISRFFEAFFELPYPEWSGYLGATLGPSELGSAMTRLFRTLPAPIRWHLVRTGLWAGAAPLARSFFQLGSP